MRIVAKHGRQSVRPWTMGPMRDEIGDRVVTEIREIPLRRGEATFSTPERGLVAGMLCDAWDVIFANEPYVEAVGEALWWFFDDRRESYGSLAFACAVLDIEPRSVRLAIWRKLKSHPILRARWLRVYDRTELAKRSWLRMWTTHAKPGIARVEKFPPLRPPRLTVVATAGGRHPCPRARPSGNKEVAMGVG